MRRHRSQAKDEAPRFSTPHPKDNSPSPTPGSSCSSALLQMQPGPADTSHQANTTTSGTLRAVNVDPVPSIQIDGEDFYALLRCSPASTKSEIKSAWISRMREFHPDHAVASSVDDANVLCSLLNEIYEVRAGFHGLVFEGPNSPF